MRKLIAGNWKMNGTSADLPQLDALAQAHPDPSVDVLICGPATLLNRMTQKGILTGGEDCHPAASGAHTGDISAAMVADAGASHVITGHSERRTDHHEDDALIAAKTAAGWAAGLHVIVCIGETEAQYRAGDTLDILRAQLDGSIPNTATAATTTVAYEPVWAIGTGLTPTTAEIADVHAALRHHLEVRFGDEGTKMRLLYGGSVKGSNAADIFALPNVDGALVGGASLKAADFSPIITALENAL